MSFLQSTVSQHTLCVAEAAMDWNRLSFWFFSSLRTADLMYQSRAEQLKLHSTLGFLLNGFHQHNYYTALLQ